jgi:AT-rich interactive domain-containing protein 1
LGNLSKHPDNIPLFLRQEQRLLALVMSQILDQGVASILSNVLFNIGEHSDTTDSANQKGSKWKFTTKKQNEEMQTNTAATTDSINSLTPANA